jgi:hypothetical protein
MALYYILFALLFLIIYIDVRARFKHHLEIVNTLGTAYLLSITIMISTLVFVIMLPFYHTVISIVALFVLFLFGVIVFALQFEKHENEKLDTLNTRLLITKTLFFYAVFIMVPIAIINLNPYASPSINLGISIVVILSMYLITHSHFKMKDLVSRIIYTLAAALFLSSISLSSINTSISIIDGNTPSISGKVDSYKLDEITTFEIHHDSFIYSVYQNQNNTYIAYKDEHSDDILGIIEDGNIKPLLTYGNMNDLAQKPFFLIGNDLLVLSNKSIDLVTGETTDTLIRFQDHKPIFFTYQNQYYLKIENTSTDNLRYYSYQNQDFNLITEDNPLYEVFNSGRIILNRLYFQDEHNNLYTDFELQNVFLNNSDEYQNYYQINQDFITHHSFINFLGSNSISIYDIESDTTKNIIPQYSRVYNTNYIINDDDITLIAYDYYRNTDATVYSNKFNDEGKIIKPLTPSFHTKQSFVFNNDTFYMLSSFRNIGNSMTLYRVVPYTATYPSLFFNYGYLQYAFIIIVFTQRNITIKKKTSDQN